MESVSGLEDISGAAASRCSSIGLTFSGCLRSISCIAVGLGEADLTVVSGTITGWDIVTDSGTATGWDTVTDSGAVTGCGMVTDSGAVTGCGAVKDSGTVVTAVFRLSATSFRADSC